MTDDAGTPCDQGWEGWKGLSGWKGLLGWEGLSGWQQQEGVPRPWQVGAPLLRQGGAPPLQPC